MFETETVEPFSFFGTEIELGEPWLPDPHQLLHPCGSCFNASYHVILCISILYLKS